MREDRRRGETVRLLVEDVTGQDAPGFALPTGTVTFLLTDVESSSRRWETLPEAMAVAIPRHYQLLDEAIVTHGGVRPVEQGEGDSVVGAFSRASDAVAAAADAQRAFGAERWPTGAELQVRMAVHTGEAQLRDEGNYFGQAVIRCARLRTIGHGGQVLLSDVTAGLVRDRLPEGCSLADLGVHRLKDLGRPEHVWQLNGPSLVDVFPPLRSLDAFRHNLPVQLTPLIGRADEIRQLARLLAEERLVTLTGSGGVGKTRLGLAVGAELVERFAGGVWLVELAGVQDPDAVASATLAALGAHQVPGGDLARQVAAELGAEPSLLVLDNCEHLLDAAAGLCATVLSANPSVSVLATSRELLGVPGEITWRVPSLGAPPSNPPLTVPALTQYDAVRLFVDRARRARPSFAVTEANAAAIAQICYRLDGIPLALELAAARCRQLPVERIAIDLDDRFRLLDRGARTVLPRHQTLAASIAWSHDRLDEPERTVFRRLGVFAGPFPLDAAEAVVSVPGDVDPVAVFDILCRLSDKSLVANEEETQGELRYLLLETLRAYALDRLRDAGEVEMLRAAHAGWCLRWLEERFALLHTDALADQAEALHDNLRAALDWGVDRADVGLRLLRPLARVWLMNGRLGDATRAIDRLRADESAPQYAADWASAMLEVAPLVHVIEGSREADALYEQCQHLATEVGRQFDAALARWRLDANLANTTAMLPLAAEHGDPYIHAFVLLNLVIQEVERDPKAAYLLEARDIAEACRGCAMLVEASTCNEAFAARFAGDLRRCIDLMLPLARSRSPWTVWSATGLLSHAALLARDDAGLNAAVEAADRVLIGSSGATGEARREVRHRRDLLWGEASQVVPDLDLRGEHLWACSWHTIARETIDAGGREAAIAAAHGRPEQGPHGQAVFAATLAAANGDEDQWHEALRVASQYGLRLIVVDALEGIAVAAASAESWAECLRLYGAAQRLRDECSYRFRFPFEQHALDTALAEARAGLEPDTAQRAEDEGQDMDWTEAAAYANRARGERKRPRHGWAGLTPTEKQVAALVAEGLTNPQIAARLFMGRATVKTHLEHIFTKTGIRSRSELAAESARRAGAHPPAP